MSDLNSTHNRVVWVDIPVADLDRAQKFYGAVLAITIHRESFQNFTFCVLDHKDGTLVTLVNWTNAPVKDLKVEVRMDGAVKTVRTVSGQRELAFTAANGVVTMIPVARTSHSMLASSWKRQYTRYS